MPGPLAEAPPMRRGRSHYTARRHVVAHSRCKKCALFLFDIHDLNEINTIEKIKNTNIETYIHCDEIQ